MALVDERADEFVRKTVGDLQANLHYIHTKRAITYRELGLRAGMTERNAFVIVKGQQKPSPDTLAKLAHALKIPVSDLFMDHERFAHRYAKAKPLGPFVLSSEAMREYVNAA